VSELDITTKINSDMGTIPPTSTIPNVYSFTIDINAERQVNAWRGIFSKGAFDLAIRPRLNDTESWKQISFKHGVSPTQFIDIIHNSIFAPGKYSKLTVVANGTSTKVYIDGTYMNNILNASVGPPTTGTWKWIASSNTDGYLKVRNFYWWTKALTDDEVKSLTSTTSGKSGYAIKGLFEDDKYMTV
jgi:hypothetical protein